MTVCIGVPLHANALCPALQRRSRTSVPCKLRSTEVTQPCCDARLQLQLLTGHASDLRICATSDVDRLHRARHSSHAYTGDLGRALDDSGCGQHAVLLLCCSRMTICGCAVCVNVFRRCLSVSGYPHAAASTAARSTSPAKMDSCSCIHA